jgi:hypothetical protein
MSDFTHSSRSGIRVYRSRYGSPPTNSYDESTAASTAVIAGGQVVMFDPTAASAHRIVRCSTSAGQTPILPVNIVGPILPVNIVGVASGGTGSDGSSNTIGQESRKVSVWEAAPDVEFLFPTKLTIASTLVNTGLELSWDSTLGIHHVSANSTAGDQIVRITGVLPGTVGDSGGFLIGRFYSSVVAPTISGL